MFCCSHRGQPLLADVGCISQACLRKNKGSEGTMLNLTDTLFIGTLFRVLMLSVAGGDGLVIGRGLGVKDLRRLPKTHLRQYPALRFHLWWWRHTSHAIRLAVRSLTSLYVALSESHLLGKIGHGLWWSWSHMSNAWRCFLVPKYLRLLTAVFEMVPVFVLEVSRLYFRWGHMVHTKTFSLWVGLEDSLLLLFSKTTVAL